MNLLTIKSRLLLILLAVGGLSCLILGAIADRSCRAALRRGVVDQLTGVRAARVTQVETYVQNMRRHVASLAEELTVLESLEAFRAAVDDRAMTLSEEERVRLEAFYEDKFLPAFSETDGAQPVLANYLPASPSGRFLQHRYVLPTARGETPDDDAEGPYAAAMRRFDRPLASITRVFGYYDLFLIDPDSLQIVYTAAKEVDLGTSLRDGPYSSSSLAAAVREAAESPDRGVVAVADFQFYRPSKGAPAAFLAAPVYSETEKVGVVAVQFPVDEINRIMTGGGQWRRVGLGETGEAILVGGDRTMRSDARGLLEDPEAYVEALRETRLEDEVVDRVARFGTTILLRPVEHEAVELAMRGEEGVRTVQHLRGQNALCSYGPLDIEGLDWSLLAQIDAAEAFAPLSELRKTLALSSTGLLLLVTTLAMVLSASLTRPIDRFAEQADRIVDGEAERFDASANDEFSALGREINKVVAGLRAQTALAEQKSERLKSLLSLAVPEHAVDRLAEDADRFREVPNVAVAAVRFSGLPGGDATRRLELLDELTRLADDAAAEARLEKVRFDGRDYLAVCGADVPRLDACRRAVEFAAELRQAVGYFNTRNGTAVRAAAAVDHGEVVTGFVGSRNVRYDVWGRPVTAAETLLEDDAAEGVRVTMAVEQVVRDQFPLEPAGEEGRLFRLAEQAGGGAA